MANRRKNKRNLRKRERKLVSKQFSPTLRHKRRQIDDEDSWIVGWDYLLLFFGGMFSALMVTTMFRDIAPDIVDIAVFQMMMAIGGIVFGLVATTKRSGGIGISVRPPNREDIEKTLPYIIGGFVLLSIINMAIATTGLSIYLMSSWNANMNIAITASVVEEAVYSFGFTAFFFKIFDYMTSNTMGKNKVQQSTAIVMASVVVSFLFFFIHIAVYGSGFGIAAMLFINRFVYAIVYLRTRNLVVPTAIHLINNAMFFL